MIQDKCLMILIDEVCRFAIGQNTNWFNWCKYGPMMAAVDEFDILLKEEGACCNTQLPLIQLCFTNSARSSNNLNR